MKAVVLLQFETNSYYKNESSSGIAPPAIRRRIAANVEKMRHRVYIEQRRRPKQDYLKLITMKVWS